MPIESLKATSLIHAGKFTKLLNLTTTTEAPTSSTSQDPLAPAAVQDDVPDEEVSSIPILNTPQKAYRSIVKHTWRCKCQ